MKKIKEQMPLYTRDGRRCGNATTLRIRKKLSKLCRRNIWLVVTDYGNKMSLSEHEIRSMFHLKR